MHDAEDALSIDEPSILDQPLAPPEASPRRRRYTLLVLAGAGLLVVFVIAALVTSAGGDSRATGQTPAGATTTTRPVPTHTVPDNPLDQLQMAVPPALLRVAPGAEFEPGLASSMTGPSLPSAVEFPGLVRFGGRIGELMVQAAHGAVVGTSCAGLAPSACYDKTGPNGERIYVDDYELPLPKGKPREFQRAVVVVRSSGSWVVVHLNNASAAYDMLQPTNHPAATGQQPPLSVEQLITLALDPALDVCAATC